MLNYNLNGEMFIVPNKISYPAGWLSGSDLQLMCENARNNGVEYVEGMPMIQVWLVVPGMSNNAGDHGINVTEDVRVSLNRYATLIPAPVLEKVNEGDSVELTFSGISRDCVKETKEDCMVTMNVVAKQRDYRYRRFGDFDEVYNKVVA